jgi:glutathionylspermidine amidase/synthetase
MNNKNFDVDYSPIHTSSYDTPKSNEMEKKRNLLTIYYYKLCVFSVGISSLLISAILFLNVHAKSSNEQGPHKCITAYGIALGQDRSGVIGYSNCNDEYVSNEDSWVMDGTVYAGMAWQCVEYSRRWLIYNKALTYDSVDIAAEIWDLPTVRSINDNTTTYPFIAYPTDQTTIPPVVGCLLIYNTDLAPTGHVAVIVDVELENGYVNIGEQNWFNDIWPSDSYARQLNLTRDEFGNYNIQDEFLIGWKCVSSSSESDTPAV